MGLAIQNVPVPSDAKVIGLEYDERYRRLELLILQGSGTIKYTHKHFVVWGRGDWVTFTDATKDVIIVGTYIEDERTYTVAEVIE